MKLKIFGKNTTIYAISNIGLRSVSFLLIPLYTHSLSISDYGVLATLLVSIQLMSILMSFGMRDTIIRFAKEYALRDKIGSLLGTAILINIVGGILVVLISVLFFTPFFYVILHSNDIGIYIGLSCCVALIQSIYSLNISYYIARNESIKFMFFSILSALLLILFNLIFIQILNLGIKGVLTAQIVSYSIIFLLIAFNVFPKVGINISFSLIPKLLRFGSPLTFSMISWFVMESSTLYFLSYFSGSEHVAIYSLGYKFASIIGMIVILPFQLAFPSFVYANIKDPEIRKTISRILTYLVIASSLGVFLILFTSHLLLPLVAPPEYSGSFLVLLLLIPGFVFTGLQYFGQTLLHINNKTYITGSVAMLFAVINLILNYILVPKFGIKGSIMSTSLTFILTGITIFILGLNEYSIPLEKKRLLISSGILIFFLSIFFIVQNSNPILFWSVTLLSAFFIIVFLFKGRFFYAEEMHAIKNLIIKLR